MPPPGTRQTSLRRTPAARCFSSAARPTNCGASSPVCLSFESTENPMPASSGVSQLARSACLAATYLSFTPAAHWVTPCLHWAGG